MFYCEKCRIKNDLPKMVSHDRKKCNYCGKTRICHINKDMPTTTNWQPTMQLRWRKPPKTAGYTGHLTSDVLQQLWHDNAGNSHWRDIAVAEE